MRKRINLTDLDKLITQINITLGTSQKPFNRGLTRHDFGNVGTVYLHHAKGKGFDIQQIRTMGGMHRVLGDVGMTKEQCYYALAAMLDGILASRELDLGDPTPHLSPRIERPAAPNDNHD